VSTPTPLARSSPRHALHRLSTATRGTLRSASSLAYLKIETGSALSRDTLFRHAALRGPGRESDGYTCSRNHADEARAARHPTAQGNAAGRAPTPAGPGPTLTRNCHRVTPPRRESTWPPPAGRPARAGLRRAAMRDPSAGYRRPRDSPDANAWSALYARHEAYPARAVVWVDTRAAAREVLDVRCGCRYRRHRPTGIAAGRALDGLDHLEPAHLDTSDHGDVIVKGAGGLPPGGHLPTGLSSRGPPAC
jgi:hypothetical protein